MKIARINPYEDGYLKMFMPALLSFSYVQNNNEPTQNQSFARGECTHLCSQFFVIRVVRRSYEQH